jgi:nucleoside-diphosphate-sugar epimerase
MARLICAALGWSDRCKADANSASARAVLMDRWYVADPIVDLLGRLRSSVPDGGADDSHQADTVGVGLPTSGFRRSESVCRQADSRGVRRVTDGRRTAGQADSSRAPTQAADPEGSTMKPHTLRAIPIGGPHGTGRASGIVRRTVLLTGASGVVGHAVLRRLRDFDVVCLMHRSPVPGPNVTTVLGDIAKPRLGLAEHAYADLAARVDAVIHCAAITDFNRTDGSLEATNIAGTEHVAAFAAAAKAVLYHVSTAFVHTTVDGDRGRTAIGYASSKLAAEKIVRSSGVAHVIVRPSVVIGNSDTGEIAAFQGLYQVAAGMFAGTVPMIPFDPSWPIDFVPADVAADAIACVVENEVSEGEFWISAGEKALRLDEGVAVAVELARDLGVSVDVPRFVPPDMFDRLIGPVFLDALPGKIRRNVLRMLEFFTTYLQSGQTKPSSLDQLVALGAKPLPDQRESLRNSLQYWAAQNGYGQAETERAA